MLDKIVQIAEVEISGESRNVDESEVNLYLQMGWKLLAIHYRGAIDYDYGHPIGVTVYVLGAESLSVMTPDEQRKFNKNYPPK